MTDNITGVAGAAEEMGAVASQVLGAAWELSRQSEHLSAEVGRFLTWPSLHKRERLYLVNR